MKKRNNFDLSAKELEALEKLRSESKTIAAHNDSVRRNVLDERVTAAAHDYRDCRSDEAFARLKSALIDRRTFSDEPLLTSWVQHALKAMQLELERLIEPVLLRKLSSFRATLAKVETAERQKHEELTGIAGQHFQSRAIKEAKAPVAELEELLSLIQAALPTVGMFEKFFRLVLDEPLSDK
jgi:hypothetical protein